MLDSRPLAVLPHEGTYPILYGPTGIPVGSGYLRGYLARPDQVGRFPVVVLIGGLEGITSHEKDLARALARRGFVVLAPNLYRDSAGHPLDSYHALTDRQAIHDIEETYEYLQSEDVDWAIPGAAGIIGLDVGGRFAVAVAAYRPWVRSLVVAETPLTGDEERTHQVADLLGHLRVPVLGLYGAGDELIASESVDEAQNRNPAGQWLLYEGAGHGFLDPDAPNYVSFAAADAMVRIIGVLQATLPAPVLEAVG
jgi:carboxymethylenebutenolidase